MPILRRNSLSNSLSLLLSSHSVRAATLPHYIGGPSPEALPIPDSLVRSLEYTTTGPARMQARVCSIDEELLPGSSASWYKPVFNAHMSNGSQRRRPNRGYTRTEVGFGPAQVTVILRFGPIIESFHLERVFPRCVPNFRRNPPPPAFYPSTTTYLYRFLD